MKKLKEIIINEKDLIMTCMTLVISKYKDEIYELIEGSIYTSLPVTQSYLPIRESKNSIKYILHLFREIEKEGAGESLELTPVAGRYIRLYYVIKGKNTHSGEEFDVSDKFFKALLSTIGITAHGVSVALFLHYGFGYLSCKDAEDLLMTLGELALYGNSLHLLEKTRMINKLIKRKIDAQE